MGFGPLRVINEDRVRPGAGFATHGHADMEIISVVLDGVLAHRDSMGTGSEIRPGEVQLMSAGSGVRHSEFNHQKDHEVHFLQIWIEPAQPGGDPGYEQTHFDAAAKQGRLCLVASPDGSQGSVTLRQDARLYAGLFDGAQSAQHALAATRMAYVHLVRGRLQVNGEWLQAGDALKLRDEASVQLGHGEQAEVLLFDLPKNS
jgi:redox-sensitive bicupin YhaK (pirin superfamily)